MKIGVVGLGSIGNRHAGNLLKLGHEVCAFDPLVRMDVKFERMIYETCDAVVIATPSLYHEDPLRACIERGKHALVEKPISTQIGALPDLLRVAREKKLVVMMGTNLRFHPCVQKAKEWIDAGDIGKPIWAQFTCGAKSTHPLYLSDGIILNTGSHEVDMALYLLGPARVVMANAHLTYEGGDDDITDFMLEHDNGCRSTFHLDFVTPHQIREAWIVGHEDRIGIELLTRHISLSNRTVREAGSFDDDYIAEMKAFIDRIEGKDVPGATGDDGLATLTTLLYVRKKAGLK